MKRLALLLGCGVALLIVAAFVVGRPVAWAQAALIMWDIAAGALLFVGLLRVVYFEKGPAYYFHSHAFTAKFSIFIAIGLLSIIPTVEFLSWRKVLSAGQVPAISAKKLRLITAVIHGELLSIAIILLCAAIMARGGWV